MAGPVALGLRQPDRQVAALDVLLRHGAAETGLLIRAARAGPAAGQQSLLHQARAVRLQRGTGAQGVRAAQQALGHRYQVALERADGLQVAVGQALSVVADQGVQRQGGGNRSDAARRQGRAGRQSLQRNPAHHAVATRPAPGAILTALQHVEGLAEQQLIDALTIVGDESALPYQRPPLSKAYMKGEFAEERLYFKPAAWYEDQKIEVLLGTRAVAIDRTKRSVELGHGGQLPYDALILATGSRPRPLPTPGADLNGVHDLRTLADVERLRPKMVAGRRMVIIGAGYIGLEAAAVARQMGLEVTVIEM
ncbi:MAG: hypothetical protein B7Z09_11780, partial [Brevundimonas diminuta]